MEVQTENQPRKTDAELLKGGPAGEHGKEMPKDGDVHPDLKKGVEAKSEVPYELNGKTFESAQEMSKYVADLERKVIAPQPVVQNNLTPIQTSQVELIDGQPLEEVMFTNPQKFYKHLENKVEARLARVELEKETKVKFWTNFYSNNPDLKGKEELVDAFVAKNRTSWEHLSFDDFAKEVAKTSRAAIKKMGLSGATELENRNAATLSSSGEGAPRVEQPKRETSFVDELNAKRRARSTRK